MNVLKYIQKASLEGRKLLTILVDPDDVENTSELVNQLEGNSPDLIFVGGSIILKDNFDEVVVALKNANIAPVVLFPGDFSQISEAADAILLLSLISGRNAEFLIGQHVKAAPLLKKWGKEIIPTSYILLDGGNITSVQRVSETMPLSQDGLSTIVDTALAGEQMGHQIVYLEAGSGADKEVRAEIVKSVKSNVDIPVIVGGGIRSVEQASAAWEAGATVVVIGTAFERGELNLGEMLNQRDEWNNK